MSISLSMYVDITSGLGAGAVVPTRDLVGRIFTANPLLPPQSFISFTEASEVGEYFGFNSEEYYRAAFYFGWVSKNQTQAQSLQFARWVQVDASPLILSNQLNATTLSAWNAVTSGSFILTMGGFTYTLSGMDFSGAGTLAAVATILEDAIQAETGGGAMWTAATVTYVATLNGLNYGGFELVGGAAGSVTNPIAVTIGGGGSDITGAGLLGWLPHGANINGNYVPGAIWSTGSAMETITQTLTNSNNFSNNFGSFLFLNNLNLTNQNVVDAANWNNGLNVLYMYVQAVTASNVVTLQGLLAGIGGVGLTISGLNFAQMGTITSASPTVTALTDTSGMKIGMPVSDGGVDIPAGTTIAAIVSATSITLSANATGSTTESLTFGYLQFPEQIPMMIEAATNYAAFNSVQNYEFQQFAGITPSVTSDSVYTAYNAISVNFYGATQTAGQQIAFYQQGMLQGLATDITDMGAYANEIWLKDAAGAALMTLLLNLAQVPANAQGSGIILATLQGVINQALNNGTISVGKSLTTAQQQYIISATGDPFAWHQVQNDGYWIDVVITPSGNPVIYTAVYTLIYSKDDGIRKVIGTHTLI